MTSGCGVGAGRQRLPQAGQEVGGSGPSVLRQTGQGGQLPGRNVPDLRQPAGTGPGGQTALSAGKLDLGQRPVRCAGCAGGEAGLMVEDGVGPGDAGPGLGAGASESRMCGMIPSGCHSPSGAAWRHWGCATSWTFRAVFTVWPPEPVWTSPAYQDRGRPLNRRCNTRRLPERHNRTCGVPALLGRRIEGLHQPKEDL